MAPIIFCKCTQCICKATVLIHTEENTDGANNFQDFSKTRNYSSSYENYGTQSTSPVVHQNVAGAGVSKNSLESIFFVLLIILILICE